MQQRSSAHHDAASASAADNASTSAHFPASADHSDRHCADHHSAYHNTSHHYPADYHSSYHNTAHDHSSSAFVEHPVFKSSFL